MNEVVIKRGYKTASSEKNDIIMVEGDGNYSYIHYANGQKVTTSYTLRRFEERLSDFCRINRKYLVNPSFIERVNSEITGPHVLLSTGLVISVPRRKVKSLADF